MKYKKQSTDGLLIRNEYSGVSKCDIPLVRKQQIDVDEINSILLSDENDGYYRMPPEYYIR